MDEVIEQVEQTVKQDNRLSPGLGDLTLAETHIISLIAKGMSNVEIARKINRSTNTVKTHIRKAYKKMGVDNRVFAAEWFRQEMGKISPLMQTKLRDRMTHNAFTIRGLDNPKHHHNNRKEDAAI